MFKILFLYFAFYLLHSYPLLLAALLLILIPSELRRRKDIKGQTVLITGAGSGVGRQLAIQFSKHSTRLVLLDINKTSLLETEKLLDIQSSVFVYECDVSKPEVVYEVSERVRKEAGDVDILVNNAGIVSGKRLQDLPDEMIVKTMEVNALAHFWTCKAFLPAMMSKNRGHIVSVASILSKSGCPLVTDYCASKYAALGFAESLEMELREQKMDGIRVTTVCPSHINTGLFQGANMTIGSVMTPEYVAENIVKGVLKEREIIYLPYYMEYGIMLKDLAPRWLTIWFFEKTGLMQAMKNFTGRTTARSRATDEDTRQDPKAHQY